MPGSSSRQSLYLFALITRQHAQRIHRQLRIQRQGLVGRDDGIAAEDRREPRNAGRNNVLVAIRNLQRVKIADCRFQQRVKNIVIGLEVGGRRFPARKIRTPLPQLMVHLVDLSARLAPLHERSDIQVEFDSLQRLQTQLPAHHPLPDLGGNRRHFYQRLAHHAIEPAIVKRDAVLADDGLVILAVLLACHAADLEYIDEVRVQNDFHRKVDGRQVEILEGHPVEEDLRRQQLFATNVNCIFGQIERIAQRDVAGGQLNLRGERFFRGRRQHDRAVTADAQFQLAEEARVVVKEADIRRTRRIDIAGHTGCAKGLAVDQGEIIHLARLKRLKRESRLDVRRRNLDQVIIRNRQVRVHACPFAPPLRHHA